MIGRDYARTGFGNKRKREREREKEKGKGKGKRKKGKGVKRKRGQVPFNLTADNTAGKVIQPVSVVVATDPPQTG